MAVQLNLPLEWVQCEIWFGNLTNRRELRSLTSSPP